MHKPKRQGKEYKQNIINSNKLNYEKVNDIPTNNIPHPAIAELLKTIKIDIIFTPKIKKTK